MSMTDLPLDRPVATLMVLVCVTVLGSIALFYLPLGFMPVVQEPEVDRFLQLEDIPIEEEHRRDVGLDDGDRLEPRGGGRLRHEAI